MSARSLRWCPHSASVQRRFRIGFARHPPTVPALPRVRVVCNVVLEVAQAISDDGASLVQPAPASASPARRRPHARSCRFPTDPTGTQPLPGERETDPRAGPAARLPLVPPLATLALIAVAAADGPSPRGCARRVVGRRRTRRRSVEPHAQGGSSDQPVRRRRGAQRRSALTEMNRSLPTEQARRDSRFS